MIKTDPHHGMRDKHGALLPIAPRNHNIIQKLIDGAARAEKIGEADENGDWNFGAGRDGNKFTAVNWSPYAFGRDFHNNKCLAVVQIREYSRKGKWDDDRYPPQIRKNYMLLGRNEDETVFAHSVQARVIHAAIKRNRDVILACQKWIFGAPYHKLLRQGDIAMIPVSRCGQFHRNYDVEMFIEHSHRLRADITTNGIGLYAKNPRLTHLPGVHPVIQGTGWWKIVVGKRAPSWSFAAPTVD